MGKRGDIWNVEHDQQPTNLRQLREAIVSPCENVDQQIIQNAFDKQNKQNKTKTTIFIKLNINKIQYYTQNSKANRGVQL